MLGERDRRTIVAFFDQLAASPAESAETITVDWDGFPAYAARFGRFTIGYVIDATSGEVTITLIRPRRG